MFDPVNMWYDLLVVRYFNVYIHILNPVHTQISLQIEYHQGAIVYSTMNIILILINL